TIVSFRRSRARLAPRAQRAGAAGRGRAVLLDLVAQPGELRDAPVELGEAAREQLIEALEHRAGRAAEGVHGVELADLGEREAEELEALDEAQALELVGAVDAPAARAAAHAGQQAELLV